MNEPKDFVYKGDISFVQVLRFSYYLLMNVYTGYNLAMKGTIYFIYRAIH